MSTLRENQRVAYDLEPDRRGKMAAANLRSADEAAAPEQAETDEAESGQAE
jgi:CspA family cold shock protein